MDLPKVYLEFEKHLKVYNQSINIFSASSYEHLSFHIQDSILLSGLIPESVNQVLDFGSGSGLPSVILANERPDIYVVAIESKAKKRRFIQEMKHLYRLNNLYVFNGDIHQYLVSTTSHVECVTAKAFGSLGKIQTILNRANKSADYIYIPISYNQANGCYKDYADKILSVKFEKTVFYYLKVVN